MKLLRTLVVLLGAASALGCEQDVHPCNADVHANEAFTVTVTEPSGPARTPLPSFLAGLPSCGLEDVALGQVFDLELTEHVPYGNSCYHFTCPKDFPSPSQDAEWNGGYGLDYVCVQDRAKVRLDEACELGRLVGVYNAGAAQGLYETPGHPNEHSFVRALSVLSEGGCPGVASRYPAGVHGGGFVCADQWSVRLAQRTPSAGH